MNFLRRSLSCLFFITMMITSTQAYAENILAREYFLKAAFLYNFARLVEWPATTFKTETDPFRLCFIGKEPFNKALRSIRNKKVNSRPLMIQRDVNLNEASRCQILFISQSERHNIPFILTALHQTPVLTVSESAGFAEQNGHIRFFLSNDEKLRLEVNLDAITQAGLKISSRILSLAKIVSSKRAIMP
ncbi:MAG: YfiR family protein [Gammaproteobacteria bacterium]|nr:YfiR family protein [Gammaproteobacteria bacterium]